MVQWLGPKDTSIHPMTIMVHKHWASDARNQWSHARLHNFLCNQQCGMHMYTVFFHNIVIVLARNYHNMVKKYCIHMYTSLLELGYLGKCEDLHEITDFVHEMLNVCACAPLSIPGLVHHYPFVHEMLSVCAPLSILLMNFTLDSNHNCTRKIISWSPRFISSSTHREIASSVMWCD